MPSVEAVARSVSCWGWKATRCTQWLCGTNSKRGPARSPPRRSQQLRGGVAWHVDVTASPARSVSNGSQSDQRSPDSPHSAVVTPGRHEPSARRCHVQSTQLHLVGLRDRQPRAHGAQVANLHGRSASA